MTNAQNSQDNSKEKEIYAHYLWHLAAIGMFDHIESPSLVREVADDDSKKKGKLKKDFSLSKDMLATKIWNPLVYEFDDNNKVTTDQYSTTVAILDTGIYPHIAFKNNIDHHVDFSTVGKVSYFLNQNKTEENARIRSYIEANINKSFQQASNYIPDDMPLKHFMESIVIEDLDPSELITNESDSQLSKTRKRNKNTSHGTALAGLVAGYHEYKAGYTNGVSHPMLYSGVDPSAKLISINTSFGPNPFQLMQAIIYARRMADIVLFARSIPDPFRLYTYQDIGNGTRLGPTSNPDETMWRILEQVINDTAQSVPFVSACGNQGKNKLLYPASISENEDSNIISVGAVSYNGLRSSYSNYGNGLSVVAPSGDGEIINRHQIRLNPRTKKYSNYAMYGDIETDFTYANVITTDIPGKYGYVNEPEKLIDKDSLTEFSGTSAAAAIVAGVISLYRRTLQIKNDTGQTKSSDAIFGEEGKVQEIPWSGAIAKTWLENNANKEVRVGTDNTLTPDNSNIGEPAVIDGNKEYWFGKGLIQVDALFDSNLDKTATPTKLKRELDPSIVPTRTKVPTLQRP